MSDHYQSFDPEVLDNMREGSIDFEYPEENEPMTYDEKVTAKAADLAWALFSRLAQVRSTSAHALWYAISYQPSADLDNLGAMFGVTKQRMHTAIKEQREALRKAQELSELPSNVTVRFNPPRLIKK